MFSKNLKNKFILYSYVLFILGFVILMYIYWGDLKIFLDDPVALSSFIESLGLFGPIALIIVQIIQVIIFPIPGPVFSIAGGFAYGILWGTVYSIIGTFLGSLIVFHLGKKFGRKFVREIINEKDIRHFDIYFKKKGKFALFIGRCLPVLFPNDIVSYAVGVTSISYRAYTLITLFGLIPNIFLLNYFGYRMSSGVTPVELIFISVLGILVIAYIFRHYIKVMVIKEIRKVENKFR